jgi:hypothetical protein
MIKILTKESREGDLAVKTTEVTFLCIPIFKYKKTTTNNKAVALLTVVNQPTKVTGFI